MGDTLNLRRPYTYGPNLIVDPNVAATYTPLKASDTVTASSVSDPQGGTKSMLFTAVNAATTAHCLTKAVPLVASRSYRFSAKVFYSTATAHTSIVYLSDNTITSAIAFFSISTGLKGTTRNGVRNARMRRIQGRWYQVSIEVESQTTANHTFRFGPATTDNLTSAASGAKMIFCDPTIVCKMSAAGASDAQHAAAMGSDEGVTLVGGHDGYEANIANVSAANTTRTVNSQVLLVQALDATGAVAPAGASSATASFSRVTDGTHNLSVQPSGSAIETTGIIMEGTDGTYGRAVKVGTDGAVYTEQNSLLAGEDAVNGWRSVSIKDHNTLVVNQVSASFTTEVDILSSMDVSKFASWSVYVKNGSNALTACNVKVSSDGSTWYTITAKDADETVCQTLGANLMGVAYMCNGPCHKYLKVTATAGTATITTTTFVGRY